jgi:hypothetical protein
MCELCKDVELIQNKQKKHKASRVNIWGKKRTFTAALLKNFCRGNSGQTVEPIDSMNCGYYITCRNFSLIITCETSKIWQMEFPPPYMRYECLNNRGSTHNIVFKHPVCEGSAP